ncbi:unnamed protein product [Urochloa humidicola]
MASSVLRSILRLFKSKAAGPELLDLQDDLLREILLRIGSPADLIRASAACVAFHRLVTEPSFSRRYRSIHPPLLLGFLSTYFQPAEAPHPNAPAGRALYRAATFSFNHRLPRRHVGCFWETCDFRDGRILLKCRVVMSCRIVVFLNLAVCDPLSQLHMLLPFIPNSLLASFQLQPYNLSCFEAFLVPSSEEDDETLFRVIGLIMTDTKLVVFVFDSSSGCWSVGTSMNWGALNLPPGRYQLKRAHFVHGCFFWKVRNNGKLLKLDMGVMKLSTLDLPPGHHSRFIAIAEAREGKLALFSQYAYDITSLDYYTTTMQNKSERDNNWQVMNTIPLPTNHEYYICGADGGYIFIIGFPRVRGPVRAVCFSLEVRSLKIERVCSVLNQQCDLHPYFGYPPPISLRVIQSAMQD